MEFGECVQANKFNDPRNDMQARIIEGVYLQPAENQLGHCIMDLQTGRDAIRGVKIKVTPLTETIKQVAEGMTLHQGHKTLEFTKKSRETLPPEDLVPCPDYVILNNCNNNDDANKRVDDANGKELFGDNNHNGDLVENLEENKNINEHKRFLTMMSLKIWKEWVKNPRKITQRRLSTT